METNLKLKNQNIEEIAKHHANWNPQPECQNAHKAQARENDNSDWIQHEDSNHTHEEESENIALQIVAYTAAVLAKQPTVRQGLEGIPTFPNPS